MLPLIIISGLLVNWLFLAQLVFASPLAPTAKSGHNTVQQFLQQGQQSKANQGSFKRPATTQKPDTSGKQNTPLPSSEPAKMHDLTYVLDDTFVLHRPTMKPNSQPDKVKGMAIPGGTTPLIAKGSDGRLEIDLPRGSLDFSQAKLADGSAPVGQLFLQLHQVSGHAIEEESLLGAYQIQILDSQGNAVQGVQLMSPATVVYHYQTWELRNLNMNPNLVRLAWPQQLAAAQSSQTTGLVMPMANNASAQTLSAQSSTLVGTLAVSSPPSIANPATPDLFEASGNAGQYAYSYPITVAPGSGGFAPQLALSYSSQSTNERYSRTAPAGAEGDGWSLSMGSITVAQYNSDSTGGTSTWYSINGVDGVSDKLVPNPAGQTTWYITQHISGMLIERTGQHWKVWAKDGTYYELGNTSDSQQQNSGSVYEWDLNKILAPYNSTSQVKTMFISYLQDSPDGGTTIRASGIKQIQYGFATSNGATTLSQVAGTIDFSYLAPTASSPWASTYPSSYYTSCNPYKTTTLRCDDPIDDPNGLPASPTRSTLSLKSIKSYVGNDSSNSNLEMSYAFAYTDTTFWLCHDPLTQIETYCAGEHLLTSITPSVSLQGTSHALKPVTFGYTTSGQNNDHYYDHSKQNLAGTGNYGGQNQWQYLNHYEDLRTGTGANIFYATGYGNMDGTPIVTDSQGNITDDRFDPQFCFQHTTCTGVYAHPDDDNWSVQIVVEVDALGTDSSGNPSVAKTQYAYDLKAVASNRTPAASCNPVTGTGIPSYESDCVADNWSPGYDGTQTPDHDQDWQDYYHSEFRGFHTVYIFSAANNLTVDSYFGVDGWWTPTSNGTNYNSGERYQEDVYQGGSETPSALLKETRTYFAGVGNTPDGNAYSGFNTCHGSLSPIYTPCIEAPLETKTFFFEGNGNATNAPWIDTTYTYNNLNSTGLTAGPDYNNLTQKVITGSNLPTSIYPLTEKWTYTPHNGTDSNGIFYYDVDKVTHSEVDDNSGHVWQCQDTTYDEGVASGVTTPAAGWPTTQTSYSTCGNVSTALKSYTGYDQYGNQVATVDPLGVANPTWLSPGNDGCTMSTPAYLTSAWTTGRYSTCAYWDTGHAAANVTLSQDALGHSTNASYDYTSGDLLTSTTDPNGQVTSYSLSYDSNGNETITVKSPGETGTYTTRQSENSQCADGITRPCYEIDTNTLLYSSAVSRTFYDAQGRAIETRTPGPTPGDDTVVMTVYNDQNNTVWKSVPFQVSDQSVGSGWLDPSTTKDINTNTPAGTTTFMDALGRTIAVQDPNWNSTQEPGINCSWTMGGKYTACVNYQFNTAIGDYSPYVIATSIDANNHVSESFTDVLGQVRYVQTKSGVPGNGSLTIVKQVATQYNAVGKPTSVTVTDEAPQSGQSITSVTTTATYDDLGRQLTAVDPDQGTFTYSYDADGHVLSVTQTSGSNSRTLGYNYDILGRVGCEQTAAPTINTTGACSAGNPLLVNTYDTTVLGTQGSTDFPIGHLTQSVATTYYPDSTSATVTQKVQTNQRGQSFNTQMQLGLPASWNVTAALPSYQLSVSYNDANQVTATTATAGTASYSFSPVYDATNGSLIGLSSGINGGPANLASLAYNEYAQLSGITLLNGSSTQVASVQYSYDGDQRPNSLTANWLPGSGNSGQILSQGRSYDNAGNVISSATTFAAVPGQSGSGGSEAQNFCYDEQNRLVWAGNGGSQPGAGNGTCGSGTLSSGLTGAGYTAPYQYTNLGQIWQGPANGSGYAQEYLYCDSSHPHQLTGLYALGATCSNLTGAVYSATYDPWGNVATRTFNNIAATLSYDALNRLTNYSASNGQEQYVYDGSGQRILKRSTSGSSTTLTVYAYGLQDLTYTGVGNFTGQTDYYSVAGHLIGEYNGSTTVFNMTDAQGSVLLSLTPSAVIGEQTFGPYGNQRYGVGTIGTPKGYTGQLRDSLTGLDYYNMRFYDPVVGAFLSLDTKQGNAQGMSPYLYVGGNPETKTDPTGQRALPCTPDQDNCGPHTKPCPSGTYWSNGNCVKDSKPPDPCADGPNWYNNCKYSSGECKYLTARGCSIYKA
ncbi:MAG TPA: RHS repeat-associated core domain-containing protein, partial [Ktedonobacteraceae bacterium]